MGRAALAIAGTVAASAREHSQAMARGAVPSGRDGFERRAEAISVVPATGGLAEKVACDPGPEGGMVRRVADGWPRSRRHRRNIEGEFHATGVGVAAAPGGRHYVTQIFVPAR